MLPRPNVFRHISGMVVTSVRGDYPRIGSGPIGTLPEQDLTKRSASSLVRIPEYSESSFVLPYIPPRGDLFRVSGPQTKMACPAAWKMQVYESKGIVKRVPVITPFTTDPAPVPVTGPSVNYTSLYWQLCISISPALPHCNG